MFAEDTASFFTDFGVNATVGAVTARVIFDRPDANVFSDMQILSQPSMVFRGSDFPALARGDSVSIAATTYEVREITHEGVTGDFMRATLK